MGGSAPIVVKLGGSFAFSAHLRNWIEADEVDLFVSKAASEVVRMYRQELKLPKTARVFPRYYGECRAGRTVLL